MSNLNFDMQVMRMWWCELWLSTIWSRTTPGALVQNPQKELIALESSTLMTLWLSTHDIICLFKTFGDNVYTKLNSRASDAEIATWRWSVGGGFPLARHGFGLRLDKLFPACAFIFQNGDELARAPIPVLRPGSVHSGWASWDECERAFLDELRVSSFPGLDSI